MREKGSEQLCVVVVFQRRAYSLNSNAAATAAPVEARNNDWVQTAGADLEAVGARAGARAGPLETTRESVIVSKVGAAATEGPGEVAGVIEGAGASLLGPGASFDGDGAGMGASTARKQARDSHVTFRFHSLLAFP